ncbi:transcriptional regulator [Actinorhabdospora filicis]|uniref:Transcriptional regulator n=1 Tax=Actinorhabdospora filicis TaxID=1785913 RepID=A0A9W6SKA1_9ACTN|nr:TetR/AcrR family transcriptional regulator [Actinorhabdospora filicis]GLZ77372.1 transcriptional regulator [Actinorhabdospora filicis]
MPKFADHDQRRSHIASALMRIVAAQGLHAVTMRAVALEAGVSVRLVQYYFGTKERLMFHAVEVVSARINERLILRLRGMGEVSARVFIEAVLDELLPTDDDGRVLQLVFASYSAMAMTDPELIGELRRGPVALEGVVIERFEAAGVAGELREGRDPRMEAIALLAMHATLGTSIVLGHRSVDEARRVIGYQLDRAFV